MNLKKKKLTRRNESLSIKKTALMEKELLL